MLTKIRYQLNTIRQIVKDSYSSGRNVHFEIGEDLNTYRTVILNNISNSEKEIMENIVRPLKVISSGPFSISSSIALKLCDQLISLIPNEKKIFEEKNELQRIIPIASNIFIIHGHDTENLLILRNMLKERFHLNPIILREQPGKGRTIIEKFEQEAHNCSYAFALTTPDDQVENDDQMYFQTRPNVIFEIGWFYSRLGRDRVSILFKKGTKIHSDLDGIGRIEFNQSVNEIIIEIEKELIAAKMI
jgi:predicted nucleotide-binding protein